MALGLLAWFLIISVGAHDTVEMVQIKVSGGERDAGTTQDMMEEMAALRNQVAALQTLVNAQRAQTLNEANEIAGQMRAGEWPNIPPGNICLPVSAFSMPSGVSMPTGTPPEEVVEPPSCDTFACAADAPATGVTVKVNGGSWDPECIFDHYYAWSNRKDIKTRSTRDDMTCEQRGLTIFTQAVPGSPVVNSITVEKSRAGPVWVYLSTLPHTDTNPDYYGWASFEALTQGPDSKWELAGNFPSFYSWSGTQIRQNLVKYLMTESKLELNFPCEDCKQFYGWVGIGA
jgi:hypothetical protein